MVSKVKFKSAWDHAHVYRLPEHYDFNPVPGFQSHASESIEELLGRLRRGDVTVIGDTRGDEEYPFDTYPDPFDVMDTALEMSQPGDSADESSYSSDSQVSNNIQSEGKGKSKKSNSESSNSKPSEQPLGSAQEGLANSGDSEIA